MSKGPPPGGMQDWFSLSRSNNAEFKRIATEPLLMGVVAAAIRGDGFTNRVPVMCGPHETGYAIHLTIRDGEIFAELRGDTDSQNTPDQFPMMLEGEKGLRFSATCTTCGKTSGDVSPVRLLSHSIKAIAGRATRRPSVRF